MTAAEMYELPTQGGATDFARLIQACESFGPYCLIGGLAVNCYVEPLYTLDADVVVHSSILRDRTAHLEQRSSLRIQFTTDERYQSFLPRSVEAEALGMRVKIACLEDVTRGTLWAFADARRRLTKRKKDELDLIRLVETYPRLKSILPRELLEQIEMPDPSLTEGCA
jgi:hypothetical protein